MKNSKNLSQNKFKIAVLASTRGTDLQAIIDEINTGKMQRIELAAVISNKKNCYALQRAQEQGFKTHYINPKNKTLEEFDKAVSEILDENKIDLIVMVGFMRILSSWFINKYENKIINVHPALLPKYGGEGFYGSNVHEAVLKAGEKETGCTIHYVTENVDQGPIILQKKVAIKDNDTPETLKEKVQALEKKWYPEVIRQIAKGSQIEY